MTNRIHPLGIYEKALPDFSDWNVAFDNARKCGFDYMELSVDETDQKLERLNWTRSQRQDFIKARMDSGIKVLSMCLSGHRKYPFGSHDVKIREKAKEIMQKALELASDLGIRTIQLAGYDVYYEQSDKKTRELYAEGMMWASQKAAAAQVMIATEIMDTPFQGTISAWKPYCDLVNSPWFCVYPDVGNLSAWAENVEKELTLGISRIVALHLKETLFLKDNSEKKFRDLSFGSGDVNFEEIFRILKKLNYRGSFVGASAAGESSESSWAQPESKQF